MFPAGLVNVTLERTVNGFLKVLLFTALFMKVCFELVYFKAFSNKPRQCAS